MSAVYDDNPLEFWVAYMPNSRGKRNYMSDGKGHLRIFKTSGAINEYLKTVLAPAELEQVVVHSIQGQIVVPEDDVESETDAPSYSTPVISTLAANTLPTATELLESVKNRRKRNGR